MDINMLIFALICYLLANSFEARDISLTKEEDLALEKQLRIINKPGVAVITTEHGDIYDCVDFYKQPAFDHPLLKNHTFHPQMNYKYQENFSNTSSINEYDFKPFKDGGCPIGSVPIRRITKADLIREKEHPWRLESLNGNELDLAIVQTQPGYGPFAGAGMSAGLYKPPVKSGPSYSAARMRIQNGNDAIQVGWRVDPLLYGDDKLRFYVYFKAGSKECFNTRCAGFISVNSEFPLDYAFMNHYRTGSGVMPETKLYLIRDILGNWWIEVGRNHTQLGFWPPNIFNGLNNMATYIDWGGEVLNTPQAQDIEMGLGHFPDCNALVTAYCRAIRVITPERKILDAATTQSYMTNKKKYSVLNIDRAGFRYRHALFYGGPYNRT